MKYDFSREVLNYLGLLWTPSDINNHEPNVNTDKALLKCLTGIGRNCKSLHVYCNSFHVYCKPLRG